jgi:gamma-glutamylcyclotransferase (GGCT)/AIG2-like uncharacterized protein YtfP
MRQYLFVYGSLKRGQMLHHRLGLKPIFQTTLKGFDCYIHPSIWYPALTKGTSAIIGEVYEVTPIKLKELDVLEGISTGLYTRERIEIIHPKTQALMHVFVYLKNDVSGWKRINKAIVEWPVS